MTTSEAITRDVLFRTLTEQWQITEDAIAALGAHFETPASGAWTVGDLFRHLTSISHDEAAAIRAMLASGEYVTTSEAENQAGVDRFRSLDHKMLRIELNTAHGVVWMYVQRFSNDELAQPYRLGDNEFSLGQVLSFVAWHERQHVSEACAAAGVPESAIVPVETAHRWA